MALSEQEKQMLAEIERALIAEDPRFAKGGSEPEQSGFHFDIRSIALILLGVCFLVGGVALAQVSLWFVVLSVLGFLVMLGGGLLALRGDSAPKRGGAPKSAAPRSQATGASSQSGGLGDRMEDKFRKRFER